eukprot:2504451-Pyramimonas_sp.AAC.1
MGLVEPPQDASKRPKPVKYLRKISMCCLRACSASDGLPRPQKGYKMAQGRPYRRPRELQDRRKSTQEGPKSPPRGRSEA